VASTLEAASGTLREPQDAGGAELWGRVPGPGSAPGEASVRAWRDVLDRLPMGVAVTDGQGLLHEVNAPLRRLLRLRPGELTLPCAVHGDACPARLATVLDPSRADAVGPYAVTVEAPDGDAVTVEVTWVPLAGAGGGQVGLLRDITEERSHAEANGLLLSLIAHELRTPIQHVMGFASILSDVDGLPPETLRRFLGYISDESRRLARLVDDLAEFSRIEQGHLRLDRRPARLDQVLEGAIGRLEPSAQARQVTLALAVHDSPARANTDPLRVEQVITNLVENALKFVPAGGRVDVSLHGEAEAWVIRVQDTGPGLPPEVLAHVFERYYQGPQAPTIARNGMGLGLYISREIVRGLGGDLRAESTVGIGTTFTVRLPRTEVDPH